MKAVAHLSVLSIVLSGLNVVAQDASHSEPTKDYGVDSSFPMHYLSIAGPNPLGSAHRVALYREFIDGCVDHYGSENGDRCVLNEEERIEMNLQQPREMQNYTSAGFAKVEAPKEVTQLLQEFWERHGAEQEDEKWPKGNTYVNHWETGTTMIPVSDELQDTIADFVQPVLEAWTGQPLIVTSVYGVRVYHEGSILAPHVDRLPLVSSCILNVAQDVDEEWPLEVIAHDGKSYNVTSHPGDMILYESHSVIHGRPFALKGRYYANIFVHFEPHGHTHKHAMRGAWGTDLGEELEELAERYKEAESRDYNFRRRDEVPEYVAEDKERMWRQEYVYQLDKKKPVGEQRVKTIDLKKITAHTAAALGKLEVLKEMESKDPSVLLKADDNGWRPIHEAARSGETEVLKYLVSRGADVNERTNDGKGASPLFWAEQMLDEDHDAIKFLKQKGAKSLAPKRAGEEL